ncbi:MAG: ATPase, T2SS/T4P/T4SS family, partial [Myxococcota bacterium]
MTYPSTIVLTAALLMLSTPLWAQDQHRDTTPPAQGKGRTIVIRAADQPGAKDNKDNADTQPPSRLESDLASLQEALRGVGLDVSIEIILLVVLALALVLVLALGFTFLRRPQRKKRHDNTILLEDLNLNMKAEIHQLPAFTEELLQLCAASNPSIILILNKLLGTGLSFRASDIHLTPDREEARVTLRVNGLLYEHGAIPSALYPALVSRIKVVSDLAIYKKNVPQDGRLSVAHSRHTARVSILPTNHGEKVVMRLAAGDPSIYNIERVGMRQDVLDDYRTLLNRDQGVI